MKKNTTTFAAALVLALLAAVPAMAVEAKAKNNTQEDYGDARAKGRDTGEQRIYPEDRTIVIDNRITWNPTSPRNYPTIVTFSDEDRARIRAWIREDTRVHCPAGKKVHKHKGCAPYDTVRTYSVGQILPVEVVRAPAPAELIHVINVPNAEGRLFVVDGDILLIDADGRVLDAVPVITAIE